MTNHPRFIAICGNPKAGKSTAQAILEKKLGYLPIDDGHVLRDFCVRNLGMTWDQVSSQAGKGESIDILGKTWERRKLLGVLGNHLEEMFGTHIMPFIATRSLYPNAKYSFGSVRKDQGHFYRQLGGMVIEIKNPDAPPSGNDFDVYDRTCIDATIVNSIKRYNSMPMFEADILKAVDDFATKTEALDHMSQWR